MPGWLSKTVMLAVLCCVAVASTVQAQGVKNRRHDPIELMPADPTAPDMAVPPMLLQEGEAVKEAVDQQAPPTEVAVPSDSAISVMPVSHVSLDTLGLYDNKTGGVDFNAWQGTDHARAKILLNNQPDAIPSRVIRGLQSRLLLSSTRPPASENIQQHILVERVHALLRLGEASQAVRLLELVPQGQMTEGLSKLHFTAQLLAGNADWVCAHIGQALAEYDSAAMDWQQLSIFCLARAEKAVEMQLAIDLLHEQQQPPGEPLEQLYAVMAGKREKADARLQAPISLDIAAMVALAGVDIFPENYMKTAPIAIARLVATQSLFVEYRQADAKRRLEQLNANEPEDTDMAAVLHNVFTRDAVVDVLAVARKLQSKSGGKGDNAAQRLRLAMMSEALERDVSATAQPWNAKTVETTRKAVSPATFAHVENAIAQGQLAEAMLLLGATAGLAQNLAELDDNTLARMVAILQSLGFETEARALAAEAVISLY